MVHTHVLGSVAYVRLVPPTPIFRHGQEQSRQRCFQNLKRPNNHMDYKESDIL